MAEDSLWLGSVRKPFRTAAIGFGVITALIYAYLIFGQFAFEEPIGMYEMIRPSGRPLVAVMLLAILGTFTCTSVYLSDFKGAIERRFTEIQSDLPQRLSREIKAFESREQQLAKDIAEKLA